MKLPEFLKPEPFRQQSRTEPGQALSLRDVVYRVSRGETTGIGSIPLEYGDDDVDDSYLNGLEAEELDVLQQKKELDVLREKVDYRLKFLKEKTTKIVKQKEDEKEPIA